MSSDADIVVLSLLAEQPRHGYDLDRVIEQRGYRQWTSLAFSSIYYLLKRLSLSLIHISEPTRPY